MFAWLSNPSSAVRQLKSGAERRCLSTSPHPSRLPYFIVYPVPAITFRDGNIVADGASRISVYNINGQLAADNAGSTMSTSGMSKGVYVIVATDTAGHTATSKIG